MKTLTGGQKAVLVAATLPMITAGGFGGWGTYTNITSVFHRSATALGVVAAGEGATLVLALVLVGLTMLGQSSPLAIRAGLWTLPAVASVTGVLVAPGMRDAVVFAMTPMAVTVSAEGLGLLARRIVAHTTGVDVEAQRRNATTLRKIAYHRARAERHPNERVQKRSDRAAWRLLRRVGAGDAELGSDLVVVQRERLTEGADEALAVMLGATQHRASALPSQTAPELEAAIDEALEVAKRTAPDTASGHPDTGPDKDADTSGHPDTEPDEEDDALPLASPDTRPDSPDALSVMASAAGGPADLVKALAAHGVPPSTLVSEAVRLRPDMNADSIRRTAKRLSGTGFYP